MDKRLLLAVLAACCAVQASDIDEELLMMEMSGGSIEMVMSRLQSNTTSRRGPQLFDMDIRLNNAQRKALRGSRKAMKDLTKRWTGAEVPWEINLSQFCTNEVNIIRLALMQIEATTCIKFRPAKPEDKNRIKFDRTTKGCWSYVGARGGTQTVNLDLGCRHKHIVVHEVCHALGLWHEQMRPDRDDHVDIRLDNVPDNQKHNFKKLPSYIWSVYDMGSVMQYSRLAFSKDGYSETICPKDVKMSYLLDPGVTRHLAFSDIKTLNIFYGCGYSCDVPSCKEPCFTDKDCKCICPSMYKPPPVPECKDMHTNCAELSAKGLCKSKATAAMTKFCRKTCGYCYNPDGSSVACKK